MLKQLVIEQIALIERLELSFHDNLAVITGETGAGKSIILDSLGLVLGERADSGLIRAGQERAIVAARFAPPEDHPAWHWLQSKDLDLGEEEIFLRRVLTSKGRGRALINETPVPVATLAELGNLLVDIHGQHDHQSLVHPKAHLEILDAFGCNSELAQKSAQKYVAWHKTQKELEALREKAQDAADRRAFLAFQLEELESAAIQPNEAEELEQQRSRLAHASRLAEAAHEAKQLLNDSEHAAASLTGQAASTLESASRMDSELESIAEAIRSLQYELDDVGERVGSYLNQLDTDPSALQVLEERLDTIHRLARKHRREPDELVELTNQWRADLNALDNLEGNEAGLVKELAAHDAAYRKVADKLSTARRKASEKLSKEVEVQLKDLYMQGTRVAVSLTPRTRDALHPRGMEEAEFLVSANPGEPLKPLRQVASGGELARLMLALKSVLADAVTVPTLIFDEVDVGVGGRVASAIGSKLGRVASNRQVLAITHLPQVAAHGAHHYKVEKSVEKKRTTSSMLLLNSDQRLEELARMLAGDEITDEARSNAQAMLDKAANSH
uniref:DNA repair protein RecN n=1 Tax=Magnetococcus massalia (strain MO-1) TaxID=451514 RepID=A0A1S7LG78_MAGMO|nr:DNA repair protein RecN [Candidatus Magnetococcus massalia]